MDLFLSRRQVLGSMAGVGGALPTATVLLSTKEGVEPDSPPPRRKVVVVGGHPDDPESGCGGTMARLADLGHEVVALYITRGEAGIEGKSHQESATIRTAECQEACRVLKA